MPKFFAYIVSSIDGVIATNSKTLPNWASREDWEHLQKSLKSCDAFVMGKNTFMATEKLPRRNNTFVLTNRIKSIKTQGEITFINPKGKDLKQLLGKFKKVAVLGGAKTYEYMLNNKMIDEIFLTIEPIVLGRGIKIFADETKPTKLKLISTRRLNGRGTVLLHYKISA